MALMYMVCLTLEKLLLFVVVWHNNTKLRSLLRGFYGLYRCRMWILLYHGCFRSGRKIQGKGKWTSCPECAPAFFRAVFYQKHEDQKSNTEITKLAGKDLQLVQKLSLFGEHLSLSKLYFEEGRRIVVTEGPLQGFEGSIIAVNKRRRRITVQLDLFEQVKKIDLMYEDAEKID